MIKAPVQFSLGKGKGKQTFEIPFDETQFPKYIRYRWDGFGLYAEHGNLYNNNPNIETLVFGCKREAFPKCCGADMLHGFSCMAYGPFGLQDSVNPVNKELADQWKHLWEPWYTNVTSIQRVAIGLIPVTITKDDQLMDRGEFFIWLKTKGIFMQRWKNPIYWDSVIESYLFVDQGSENKLLTIKHGSSY